MRCYVINLDRASDRMAEFERWNAPTGITPERFAAIDGQATPPEFLAAAIKPGTTGYTAGALACALSHRALWRRVVASGESTVILEDDAVLRSDAGQAIPAVVPTLPRDWDICLLGFNTDTVLALNPEETLEDPIRFYIHPDQAILAAFQKERRPVRCYRLRHAFGTCAYAISASGARRLLGLCFPMDARPLVISPQATLRTSGIDGMLNAFYSSINAFITLPCLAMTPNTHSTTAPH